jgi:hypothetical protein
MVQPWGLTLPLSHVPDPRDTCAAVHICWRADHSFRGQKNFKSKTVDTELESRLRRSDTLQPLIDPLPRGRSPMIKSRGGANANRGAKGGCTGCLELLLGFSEQNKGATGVLVSPTRWVNRDSRHTTPCGGWPMRCVSKRCGKRHRKPKTSAESARSRPAAPPPPRPTVVRRRRGGVRGGVDAPVT